MSGFLNLVGSTFGNLTVVDRVDNTVYKSGRQRVSYLCRCSCGNYAIVLGDLLRNGKTRSCGCLRKDYSADEAARRALFAGYKQNAAVRNLDLSLTFEQFAELTNSPCHYCGAPPATVHSPRAYKAAYRPTCVYNGIDRQNNEDGYKHCQKETL